MNFGPLNRDGGERRLNVLITRAFRMKQSHQLIAAGACWRRDTDERHARGFGAARVIYCVAHVKQFAIAIGAHDAQQAIGRGFAVLHVVHSYDRIENHLRSKPPQR